MPPTTTTHPRTQSLALLPLPTVLLPGAVLGLRGLEPQQLDLVRACSRAGSGFGACLRWPDAGQAGAERGATALPAAYGTQARIEDFGVDAGGLLTLRIRGGRRFRVRRTRVRADGLVMGAVEWCAPDRDEELRPEHALLALLLQRILERAVGAHADPAPAQLDDAAWVGWRLAEWLPLTERQRQALLQQDDPHARLQQLLALLPD